MSKTIARLDRVIDLSQSVLKQLDGGAALSVVLPSARLLANLVGDRIRMHWLDFEIYGPGNVPGQKTPLEGRQERSGFALFWKLHAAEDPTQITLDRVLEGGYEGGKNEKTWLAHQPISTLETLVAEYQPPNELLRVTRPDDALRFQVIHGRRREIIQSVRAHVYQFAATQWKDALTEKENIELVGPDYRLVLDHLDALDTDVGNELQSALDLLKSNNPADWSAAALQCRNVILALGRRLYPSGGTYESKRTGQTYDLTGEKEKNRLHAYAEEKLTDDESDSERIHKLIPSVYERGSKGKSRGVRKGDAQALVVDTFELVSLLDRHTDLEPLEPS